MIGAFKKTVLTQRNNSDIVVVITVKGQKRFSIGILEASKQPWPS